MAPFVPSYRRIISRDRGARVLAVWFVVGVLFLGVMAYVELAPRPKPTAIMAARAALGSPVEVPNDRSKESEPWLVGMALLGVVALPLRLWRVRRMFRRWREVEATVDCIVDARRTGEVHYRYRVGPRDYSGTHTVDLTLWVAYAERYNARVPILVDPDAPNRSFLKHSFTLDLAKPGDQIPGARVVKS